VSGATLAEKFSVKAVACFGCPIGCGRQVTTQWGIVDGPEYETIAAFGPLNWIFDLNAIVKANHLCNDLGIDTISAGVTIAFAAYLKERGLLPREYEREAPEWGDGQRLVEIVKKIGFREGMGDLLAEGTREVAKRLGVDPGLAANVKGLEIPMHDPRAFFGMALSYATSVRGACHLRGDFYSVDLGYFRDPDLGLSQGDRFQIAGRAREVIALQNLREVFNSALLCVFTNFTSRTLAKLLSLATGWDFGPTTVHEVGGRSFDLKRKINVLQGLGPEEDRLPEIVVRPLEEGGAVGKSPADQLETAIEEYYGLREWKGLT
ncbi:MAG: aldehyde ferredoxin oxidoreductase C-terminal domain-containing protein, partial [Candidatus Korarchaeota archaeon]|nr:aldehyde ferredoxin oxidoreductase C-terminal domain-containing protein [Candidatus Korarchaeota archaeon]